MVSKKSIFKLSAREEREMRELAAAKRRARLTAENRASAAMGKWDAMRMRLDAQLVRLVDDRAATGFATVAKKKARGPLSKQARKNIAVFERDDFTCRDCRKEFDHPEPYRGEMIPGLTRGHIIPAARGGTVAIENLIAQCQPCNQALGNQVWNPDILTVPYWDFDFTKESSDA